MNLTSQAAGLYDFYVIKSSGIPLITGCTGSDFCKEHFDQHELHSGFLAALYTFAKEVYYKSSLHTVHFNDLQLNFKTDEENEFIIIFVHPDDADQSVIQDQLNRAHKAFVDKFGDRVNALGIEDTMFETFREDLVSIGVLPHSEVFSSREIQAKKVQQDSIIAKITGWLRLKP